MSKGRLVPPNLDDRTWQDLVNGAKALIPKYTDKWTDHNPSDLGITLIELFAWIAEQIIYRLNRVPDKHFIEFLNLIGVTRDPPTPAQVDITFKIAGDEVVTIPKGTQVSTPPTGMEEGVIFETDEDLHTVNLKRCIFLDTSTNTYSDYTARILEETYETIELTIPQMTTRILLLGLAVSTELPLSLTFKVPSGSSPVSPQWKYSTTDAPNDWPLITPVTNASYAFDKSARVDIHIPAGWGSQSPGDWRASPATPEDEVTESLYWIGVRIENRGGNDLTVHLDRIAANITTATHALTIKNEESWTSNGKPFQVFQLKNTPLYQEPKTGIPLEHLTVAVEESDLSWKEWQRVEDFSQPDATAYICHPVTGEISFGNYPTGDPDHPGYGSIPPEGRQIKAVSYRYVAGGGHGNVPKETIKVPRTPVPGVTEVINEEAAWGGTDWEKLEDTKRRGPQTIKIQERAVTVEDYEYLTRRATTDVAKVRCFPPKKETENTWVTEPFARTPGNVNIIIVPYDEVAPKPTPSSELIAQVKRYLNERRTITSILVTPWPPFYVEITVSATVYVKPGENTDAIAQDIREKLCKFFHPITGGPEGHGWEIGQDLYIPDVFTVIQSIPKVSYIEELDIGTVSSGPVSGVKVEIQEYELMCASELNDTNYAITVKEEDEGL